MDLSAETVLICLPTVISFWTGMTLSWGIFLSVWMERMMKFADDNKGGRRLNDIHCTKFVWIANIILFAYLFLTPSLVLPFSDAVLVINVFLTAIYFNCTKSVVRWWYTKDSCNQKPILT